MTGVEGAFERVAARLLAENEHIERACMFGSTGLRSAGKVFTMTVKGGLVARTPRFPSRRARRRRNGPALRPRSRAGAEGMGCATTERPAQLRPRARSTRLRPRADQAKGGRPR